MQRTVLLKFLPAMTSRIQIGMTAFFTLAGAMIGLSATIVVEPAGTSSRKTPIVITEIHYNPATITGASNNLSTEFIEIYNSNPFYEDLSGFRITGDIDYAFPQGIGLAGLSRLVLAKNTNDFQAHYNLSGVTLLQYGINTGTNFINSLSREGSLRLINSSGGVVLEIGYDNDNPWPVGADGTGHSLVLARPSYGENDPAAWSISDSVGGSPGAHEAYANEPLRNVFINEILAHTDLPQLDTVELYNHSNTPLDVSGCILTDDAATNKFVIPGGTTIPARGFVTFDQNQLGFALSSAGETIYLWNTNRTKLLDVVQFSAQENGVSLGRSPDGGADFYRLNDLTFGTNNAPLLVSSVVINELMYDPVSNDDNDEYIELFNRTGSPVNLSGWRLEGGIQFTFPTNTVLAANGYIVVAENLTNLLARYPQLNNTNLLGNYSGSLKNSGERVALSMPDTTNGTNTIHIVVDELSYGSGGQWPGWARGGGSSLERRDARADSRQASTWGDSIETNKAPWTIIDLTGILSMGRDTAYALELGLQGEGECLVDDVEVIYSGSNRVPNPTFNSNASSWAFRGNHIRTALEPGNGFGGTQGLRVRASGRVDTGANRIRTDLTTTIPNGATATLRAKVRWQRGWPEFYLRLHGSYLEAPTRLTLPNNLGSPGLANSIATTNIGPAIYDVSHSPVLPAANQAVVVTAKVSDPDGVQAMQLRYRIDPSVSTTNLTMLDNGTSGDAIANDGIFSATIPSQPVNTMVAFVVTATDASLAPRTSLFPTNTPANSSLPRECLVRFGDPSRVSDFGTYRQWFTTTSINSWLNRPRLSNEGIEGTFVYGDFRAIYNFSSRYAGSPYHQFWSSPLADCHYSMAMPRDNRLLGTDNFNKVHAPGDDPFSDSFLACEQTAHWVARRIGLPWSNRRFVNMYVNGSLRKANSLMEDSEVPGGELLETYHADDADGNLHKISGWFEMSDVATGEMPVDSVFWATLNPYQEPAGSGDHKLARYRWNWQGRSYSSTANDFTNIFRLMDAAATTDATSFVENLEREADMEQWMRVWAARHACGDWDFFGSQNAQNSYAYRPTKGRWQLYSWDMNTVFSMKNSTIPFAPGMGLFPPPGTDWNAGTNVTRIFETPKFRRMYWRAFKEICDGPFAATNINPYLDSRYNAFIADGLAVTSADATFSFTDSLSQEYGTNVNFNGSIRSYIANARNLLLARIALENATNFTVARPAYFATNNNFIAISGTAPVHITTIRLNGQELPVTWTSVGAWTVNLALWQGTNSLVFEAFDRLGNALTNFAQTVEVNFTGTLAAPENSVVINEIHPHPLRAGSEFVELFNRATNAFDLSGWRLNGLDYTFPAGSFIPPLSYRVLTKDWHAYRQTYGQTNKPFDVFDGKLDPDGETLTLLRPGILPGAEIVVDRVRYESELPWISITNGSSLQLIDASQDNSRVANWNVASTNLLDADQWARCVVTGIPRPNSAQSPLMIYLQTPGDIYIDDVSLVAGTTPEAGFNYVTNGGFENGLTEWTIGTAGNNSASVVSTNIKNSGNASLHLIDSEGGSTQNTSIWQNFAKDLTIGNTYTLTFYFRRSTNGGPLTVRFSNNGIAITTNPAPVSLASVTLATPNATNSIAATLPPFPPIWLNELQTTNLTGPFDNFGEREPWTELFNANPNTFNLSGYYLTDDYTNLTKWPIPATANIAPSNFLVLWLDAQTNQSTLGAPHASFRLTNNTGSLALTRITNGGPQIVDYLNFKNVPANWSYGDFPDGQPFYRQAMFQATPAAPNTNANAPLTVFINEWLADNLTTLSDPADGQFEDWFEIYNPGTNTVNLGGYYLTDNLTNKFQFLIPTNGHYTIPPGGFLLVWADNEAAQNSTNRADLHASFALARGGEAIGIFSANGTAIDTVTFGAQTTDLSQGRFGNGQAAIYSMPTRTPRTNNIIPNTAPVFDSISTRFTYPGKTVQFIATATDAQMPMQTLSFSVLAGPPGTSIVPATGEFSYIVAPGTLPGTNNISLRVIDNGTPPLSGDVNFDVVIRPLPQISGAFVGNQINLSWPATESGWRLEAQTNSLSVGLNTNWFTVSGSTSTNQMLIPISTTDESVFFRLVHP